MKEDFEFFILALTAAGSEMSDPHYFRLPVAGPEKPVFRERVYCYELYHQLRNRLEDSFPYRLCGEVDKSGNPMFEQEELKGRKPDFIVHVPGKVPMMNLVVVEVKPVDASLADIGEDIAKLQAFIERAKYPRAIMLIYGDGKREALPDIVTSAKELIADDRILLVWHSGPGKQPEVVGSTCY